MKTTIQSLAAILAMALLAPLATAQSDRQSQAFKLHNIFSKDMILQRGKPIKVWGWAKPGSTVKVTLGGRSPRKPPRPQPHLSRSSATKKTTRGSGRGKSPFRPARPAPIPVTLAATSGGETVTLDNIVLGDVWVMSGQSNMAFPLNKTNGSDLAKMANNPNLRLFSITGNEQATMQDDIRPEVIDTVSGGWDVSSPETAKGFSAIGYVFGFYLQNALDIPVGIIKNARGGASIESMVPVYKFDEDPLGQSPRRLYPPADGRVRSGGRNRQDVG
jgi:sialate O-acetylesterase